MPKSKPDPLDPGDSDIGELYDPVSSGDREHPSSFSSADYLRMQIYMDRSLAKATARLEERLTKKLSDSTLEIKLMITSAFPEGDLTSHKRAHETQISVAKKWSDIKMEFIKKAFSAGMLAGAAFAAMAVWEAVKAEIKK